MHPAGMAMGTNPSSGTGSHQCKLLASALGKGMEVDLFGVTLKSYAAG